jgi:hypothetical protein
MAPMEPAAQAALVAQAALEDVADSDFRAGLVAHAVAEEAAVAALAVAVVVAAGTLHSATT